MEIYKSIAAVMQEMGAIGKNNKNKVQGWNFRGIDDVYNELSPLLAKHGVFTVPVVENIEKSEKQTNRGGTLNFVTLKVRYIIYGSDGSSIESVIYGEAMDSGDKAINKALSIAHKYLFFQLFSIPTEEVKASDPDNYNLQAGESIKPDSELIEATNKIIALVTNIKSFLTTAEIKEFEKTHFKGCALDSLKSATKKQKLYALPILEKEANKGLK